MSFTQRSEGINKHFKMYLTSTTSLHSVLEIRLKFLEKNIRKTKENDLNNITNAPILRTTSFIEAQASKVYTHRILKFFVEEDANCINFVSETFDDNRIFATFRVTKPGCAAMVGLVEFNSHDQTFTCSCYFYERLGILYRHILKIFLGKNILEIPSHYIMKRWTKDVMKGVVEDNSGKQIQVNSELARSIRFNEVCQISRKLAEHASKSVELHEFVMSVVGEACVKVEAKIGRIVDSHNVANTTYNDNVIGGTSKTTDENPFHNILEPPRARTKGRPTNIRYKSRVEQEEESEERKNERGSKRRDSKVCSL
ncbi:protein FAR1-RELATED SEQUENCE 5-like [Amborella trichopoda]|uniref:protein FAR1-RELATED SEQUENCE 5-like n=1 Tax=Amborella trichopoda TaxID=13333 RepID=UPI0009BFDEBF|nr:protein FAR1-RELATED SEQUENCE 5-like [Amborella trichopoda]XP_020522822.1 protein FAR1-RELATED SEQUENCE 5-like [Amborella trichopoda]XP_020522823.1 protein FAR1-RELATED SEQUENCE 5-like [Amborella trichopoda]|eukprot:XP_020522821.1 protein FAR1-RELATED SEQUENCE 5-like [Amborella trichopoda]